MKQLKLGQLIGLILLIGIVVWYVWNNQEGADTSSAVVLDNTPLERDGDQCLGITEKAMEGKVAIIEFQRLELISRRANVFARCMRDRGYIENPNWLKLALPQAEKLAKPNEISKDEALENLRREAMFKLKPTKVGPIYWLQKP